MFVVRHYYYGKVNYFINKNSVTRYNHGTSLHSSRPSFSCIAISLSLMEAINIPSSTSIQELTAGDSSGISDHGASPCRYVHSFFFPSSVTQLKSTFCLFMVS